ncbi:MAG: hypothetical protein KDA25_09460 [Phycisphaerales bacterium]|nr:hypothetical protein [Phycisphaerales bacterium]
MADFKVRLIEFAELGRSAISEADSEVLRVQNWLQHEQRLYWERAIRKRKEKVASAQADLFRAQLAATDERPDCTDEKRALRKAQERLDEAEGKLRSVKKWTALLDREGMLYKAQVQSLSTFLDGDIPRAAVRLERMIETLEEYVAMAPPTTDPDLAGSGASGASGASRRGGPPKPVPDTSIHGILKSVVALRASMPDDDVRQTLEVVPIETDIPGELRVAEDQQPVPGLLDVPPSYAGLSDRIVVEAGALAKSRIWLARRATQRPGDSGWFIGDATHADARTNLAAHRMSVLFRSRPDLRSILALPAGYLVVLDGSDVAGVFVDPDVNLWSR